MDVTMPSYSNVALSSFDDLTASLSVETFSILSRIPEELRGHLELHFATPSAMSFAILNTFYALGSSVLMTAARSANVCSPPPARCSLAASNATLACLVGAAFSSSLRHHER